MPYILFTVSGVAHILCDLEVHKACARGPNGISPRLLKETANSIDPVLTLIAISSFSEAMKGSIDWKKALVVPIFKKGAHNYLSSQLQTNFRY